MSLSDFFKNFTNSSAVCEREREPIPANRICAKDIMSQPVGCIKTSMTLKEAAALIDKASCNVLPVIDDAGNFNGYISSSDLLCFGLPNTVKNLKHLLASSRNSCGLSGRQEHIAGMSNPMIGIKTMAYLQNLNPFEEYAEYAGTIKIGDMNVCRSSPSVAPDTSLMEVVVTVLASREEVVFVIDNGKLSGVIDNLSILRKYLL